MTIIRVACYERVSTEEQALRGFSIETQIENLTEYCQKNEMKIVDHYKDAGVSGGKAAFKRPEMARLLADVEAGKIDMILFTKLDRWFRNVKEYFKVQEILDKHKVEWKAIHEDYDTTTANGRMAITIFLAIAQNEREKTAERIKVVFEHKRKNKEVAFGGRYAPWGYKKVRDESGILRLIKDPETQEACQTFWDMMRKDGNMNKAARYVNETYGFHRTAKTWAQTVRNPFYCGEYKGIEDYCEPYICKEEWLRIVESRPIKATKENRVYLFTGMMRCPDCGLTLCGTFDSKEYNGVKKEYRNYRCRGRYTATCAWGRTVSEIKVEKFLLKNLDKLLNEEIARVELAQRAPKAKPKTNIRALKERLRRLNITYMAGNKTDEEYLQEDAEIKALIKKAEEEIPPEANRDLTPLKELLETDFRSLYKTFPPEKKRSFWRSIIKEIKLDGNSPCNVIFF